jgi:VIT1/CCC1 family predicted Fe2+/Mn2+ transporter
VQELGQMVPDDDAAPWKDGLVTFISFMIFGSLPLIPYIIFYFADYKHVAGQLGIASAITLLTLFALG